MSTPSDNVAPEVDPSRTPICVDLDGTLLRTDMLAETALAAVAQNWTLAPRLPFWLLRGRARLKANLAESADVDVATLPYNTELIAYLEARRAEGHPLILVTASDQGIARRIADHLGLFDEVIASDGDVNLKGPVKARRLVERFGEGGFVYAGDSRSDLPVWRHAKAAILVGTPPAVERAAKAGGAVQAEFAAGPRHRLPQLLRAMRLYQWVKNLLVFVVPLAAHVLFQAGVVQAALTIFFAFSFAASGIYIVNDLLDLQADRRHERKRDRPFASGTLPLTYGAFGPLLLIGGVALAAALSLECALLILAYATLSLAYSVRLKKRPLIDVFLLASFYTLRLFAGGLATGPAVSIWLLNFSGFLFLALAFLKRYAEFGVAASDDEREGKRRGYYAHDAPMLQIMGIGSSFVATLVLSLYVNSTIAVTTYREPLVLWGIVPLMLFWQCRLWLATSRGRMHDDPIIYTAKDSVSWITFSIVGVLYVVASVGLPAL